MRRARPLLLGAVAAVVVVAVSAPLAFVLGAKELAVVAILATGTWVSVRRLGIADLSTAASAGVGAYAGGVAPALLGIPIGVGFVFGAVAGALFTAGVAAVSARTGRLLAALATLAVGATTVSGLSALGTAGGRAGFHAVPLVTGSDRGDLVVLVALLVAVVAGVHAWSRSRPAATAAVAVRAPHVGSSLGRRPVLDAAAGGAVAGALLGLGGVASAVSTGSVFPAAYDLSFAVALVLAALVGGGSAPAGTAGAVLLWGPSMLWPTIGEVTLIGTGLVALLFLAVRPRGILATRSAPVPAAEPVPPRPRVVPSDLPMQLRPGEVLAIVGPNGAGKSTLLARLGGQLGGRPVRRARDGVSRTWQHPPDLSPEDGLAAAFQAAEDAAAAAWAQDLLGEAASTPAGADLVRLAARRPGLALLDEPSAHLDPAIVRRFVRSLADGGAAVVLAEHRRDVLDVADRTVEIDPARTTDPVSPPRVAVRRPATIAVGDLEATPGSAVAVDAETVAALRGGRGMLDGRSLPARTDTQVRRGFTTVGADDPVAADVSVGDHLGALGARDLVDQAPLLAGRAADPAGVLSGGERRVLSWLRAIAVRPRAVLLDRAGTGLDGPSLAWAGDVVAAWRAAGVPVLVHAGRPEEAEWAVGTVPDVD